MNVSIPVPADDVLRHVIGESYDPAKVLNVIKMYDETICRTFVLLIAWFNLLSRFLNGCRVPLETTDKLGHRTSPI